MTIKLIDEPTYDRLIAIYTMHPNLTYQNKGYDYPNKGKWSPEDLAAHKEVGNILEEHIIGFREFNHFNHAKDGTPRIRLQYDWTADDNSNPIPFTGVGYIEIDELFTGFKNK